MHDCNVFCNDMGKRLPKDIALHPAPMTRYEGYRCNSFPPQSMA